LAIKYLKREYCKIIRVRRRGLFDQQTTFRFLDSILLSKTFGPRTNRVPKIWS